MKELPKPWINLHVGVGERDTFLKGGTRMRVLSKEVLPDGSVRFVSSPDDQPVITAEVTVVSPANDSSVSPRSA